MTKTRINCGLLIIFALTFAGAACAEDGGARGVGTATGLPLPRFVSLKSDEVNARVGPGGDYQIAWVFRRAGLPVEVLGEFENWRQVRDASGSTGWVNAGLTSARRTAVVAPWTKDRTLFELTSSRGGSRRRADRTRRRRRCHALRRRGLRGLRRQPEGLGAAEELVGRLSPRKGEIIFCAAAKLAAIRHWNVNTAKDGKAKQSAGKKLIPTDANVTPPSFRATCTPNRFPTPAYNPGELCKCRRPRLAFCKG